MSTRGWRRTAVALFGIVVVLGATRAEAVVNVFSSSKDEVHVFVLDQTKPQATRSLQFEQIPGVRLPISAEERDLALLTFSASTVCTTSAGSICTSQIELLVDGKPVGEPAEIGTTAGDRALFVTSFQRAKRGLGSGDHLVSARFRVLSTNGALGLHDIILTAQVL